MDVYRLRVNVPRWVAVLVMVVSLAACDRAGARGTSPAGLYCGASAVPGHRPTKLVVIVGENESKSGLTAQQAPFQQTVLAKECGSLRNMHALTHGSEPNYIGIVSGAYPKWALCDYPPDTRGDGRCQYAPSRHLTGASVFSQLQAGYGPSGWRSYAQVTGQVL